MRSSQLVVWGLVIRVAQLGFAAQATFWSVVDLNLAVMPRTCEALGRPFVGHHPDCELLAVVAVDLKANVQMEHEARTVYDQRPWAQDKAYADAVVGPIQTDDVVPS